MLGPLFLTAAVSIVFGAQSPPVWLRWTGQLIVASAVALNLGPAAVQGIVTNIVPMLTSAAAIILFSGMMARFLCRRGGVDSATALFATLPGGPVEMANLANRYDGNANLVALSQTLRVAAIVIFVPPLLIILGYQFEDIARRTVTIELPGLTLVAASALIPSIILNRMRIANSFFIGPLMGVGIVATIGLPVAQIPGNVIAAAQIFLGVSLGSMFEPKLLISAWGFLGRALIISGLLVTFGLILGFLFSKVLQQNLGLMILSNAPGSVAEMAISARSISLNATIVSAYHLTRIFFIVPFAVYIYEFFRKIS